MATITPPTTTRSYAQVPGGSTLSLAVGPAEAGIATHALLFPSGEPEESWLDEEIRPGPKQRQLDAGKVYILTTWVTFLADCEVTVTVEIEKPDSSTHSTAQKWTIDGNATDLVRLDVIIQMA